jgi:uncharacterized protein (TIGR02268 family)
VPEVRVAAHVATYLRFDAPIDRASVEVEGRATRFRLVDPGERTLTLELAVEPGSGEKLGVRVRYKDGASPAYAAFALVTHPTLVDKEVEVVRRQRTPEFLEAALAQCEAGVPDDLVFSGQLDTYGVQAQRFTVEVPVGHQSGLTVVEGAVYRATRWVLIAIRLRNLPGQNPWVAGAVRLTSTAGALVKVLSVRMDRPQLVSGEEGFVVVRTEVPFWKAGEVFHLELLDKSGVRRLPIPAVGL